MLLPATPSQAQDNYWNSLVALQNVRNPYDCDETKLRLLDCIYITLRHKYPSNILEFYLKTTHQQYLSHHDLSIVQHTPVILRSISNCLTTVFISNRSPNYFSNSNPLKVYPLTRRRSTILQATRQKLNNSIGFKCARIGLVGISHGSHTHFEPYLEAQVPWSCRKPPFNKISFFIEINLTHCTLSNVCFFFSFLIHYRYTIHLNCTVHHPKTSKNGRRQISVECQ
jgi:hypothetical protein